MYYHSTASKLLIIFFLELGIHIKKLRIKSFHSAMSSLWKWTPQFEIQGIKIRVQNCASQMSDIWTNFTGEQEYRWIGEGKNTFAWFFQF